MISTISICLNAADNIKTTLNSVNSQTNQNYEHIVKDGLSTDDTIGILSEFNNSKMKFFSYADRGIYNAFNQALEHCSGEYINFLNAGDYYVDDDVLNKVESKIKETNCDLIYGDLNVFREDADTKLLTRTWKAGEFKHSNLKFGWMPPHPTVFVKKSIFETLGNFNEKFSISGDYDWLLRALKTRDLNVEYLNIDLVNMEFGGVSQSMYIKSFVEDTIIGFHHRNILLPALKRLAKIGQFHMFRKRLLL